MLQTWRIQDRSGSSFLTIREKVRLKFSGATFTHRGRKFLMTKIPNWHVNKGINTCWRRNFKCFLLKQKLIRLLLYPENQLFAVCSVSIIHHYTSILMFKNPKSTFDRCKESRVYTSKCKMSHQCFKQFNM